MSTRTGKVRCGADWRGLAGNKPTTIRVAGDAERKGVAGLGWARLGRAGKRFL